MNRFRLIINFFALFFLIFMNIASSMHAQQNTNHFGSFVRFGGGIALRFGEGLFSSTLAPSAIYEFNNQVAFGVGLNGSYNQQKNFYKSTILVVA